MPWCDTLAMNQHLIEISRNVADDAHAILMMDQQDGTCPTTWLSPKHHHLAAKAKIA
jgi:hypothetical protein